MDKQIVGECDSCGRPLYVGDKARRLDNGTLECAPCWEDLAEDGEDPSEGIEVLS